MARRRGDRASAPAGAPAAPVTVRAEVPFDELDDDSPHVQRRQARRDRVAQGAYDAGRKGRGFSYDAGSDIPVDEARQHHRRGAADRDAEPRTRELPSGGENDSDGPADPPPPARGTPSRARAWGRPNAPQVVNDGAGFLLGLVGYALFINFVRGGGAQARGWIGAKFLNRPYGQAPSGATLPASTTIGPFPGSNQPPVRGGAGVPRGTPSSTPPVTTPAVPIPYHPTAPPAGPPVYV